MTARRLTAAQRSLVRSLMTDEGETRAAATAWVLAMEVRCKECGSPEHSECGDARRPYVADEQSRGTK